MFPPTPAGKAVVMPMDVVDMATRSRMMAGIKGKNTKPELQVRRFLHAKGFRYRLHDRSLPGRPDLAFPRRRAVILVHGCFWHGHDCRFFKWPATRPEFWREKISENRRRDERNIRALKDLGWRVLIIWECAVKTTPRTRIVDTLEAVAEWLKGDNVFSELRETNDDGS